MPESDTKTAVADAPTKTPFTLEDDPRTAGRELAPRRPTVMPPEHQSGEQKVDRPAVVAASLAFDLFSGPNNHSPTFADLIEALAEAQEAFGEIERSHEARIKSKSTNSEYSYTYADLSDILSEVRPKLSKRGIAIVQHPKVTTSTVTITTVLAHKSGQWIRNILTLAAVSAAPQDIGSAITYGRRYSLLSMLGIAPGEADDDGASASGVDAATSRRETHDRGSASTYQRAAKPQQTESPKSTPASGDREMIVATREIKRGDARVGFGVKTVNREYYTDSEEVVAVAAKAKNAGTALSIWSETRVDDKTKASFQWIVEVRE